MLLDGTGTAAAPQTLEVMSQDLGDVSAGFVDNFDYGTLALGNGTYVRLTDAAQNVPAAGSAADALYVNALVVPFGTTLDLNGLHVYARQSQVGGTIVGGTIQQLTPGGPLVLDTPAPGRLSQSGQVDTWTFYGLAGRAVTVVVDTGSQGTIVPLQPYLSNAQVQVVAPDGTVLASGSSAQAGADVVLSGIRLPADGTYQVKVQAPSAAPGSTGDYVVSEWDATAHENVLGLNENVEGQLDSPYAADHWNFSAAAGEPVQFNLTAASSSAIAFDLTGPDGVTVFTGLTASSGTVTLPQAGSYLLTAHLTADRPGAYGFNLSTPPQATLTPGTPAQESLVASGQEQLYQVTLNSPAVLSISVTDTNASDQNEILVMEGQAPTIAVYQYRTGGTGPDPTLTVPAQPGTYDILVYHNLVASPGGQATVEIQTPPFAVTGFAPGRIDASGPSTLVASGVFPMEFQSSTAYQIQFISSGGTVYPASPLYLAPTHLGEQPRLIEKGGTNPPPSLSATLPAGALPAGTYSVRITDSQGHSQTMPAALTVTGGGAGVLSTSIDLAAPLGYHQASTVYVTYSNIGTAPMPAPLLVLTATQGGLQGGFFGLQPRLAGLGYFSSSEPAGFSTSVQFLASGAVPGVLAPGESVTVPVYYGGWNQDLKDTSQPVEFTLGALEATNTATIDWSSLEAGIRPGTIDQAAWGAIFPNLTASLGSTWGQYLQTLDADAVYLAAMGQPTDDLGRLLTFEIEKADAVYTAATLASVVDDDLPAPGMDLTFSQSYQQAISGRYAEGILGYGWTTNWDISAATQPNGDVLIDDDGTSTYFSQLPDGTFSPQPGSEGETLTATGGGAYRLVGPDGTVDQFNANGTLAYVEDTHGNRITASYNAAGLLASLTHSNGEFIDLAYNAAGRLASLTDSAGRTETYAYDPTGQFLTSYADELGITTYSYATGGPAARDNALAEVAYPDGTHTYFGYDSQGRLDDVHVDGGQEDRTWSYLSPGGYVTTDADGNQTTVYFNLDGEPAEIIDPLGNVTHYDYDSNLNLAEVIGPGGVTALATYDANGDVTSVTDPLGLTTQFTHDANNNLTSYTDAKGNTTSYAYDAQNDLLSVTNADGSERQATYNPLGEATQYVNANGQAIGVTYNAQGLVATESFADGTSYSYHYDARGNLLTAIDAGGTTTFSYTDPASPDLLTEVAYPDGTYLKFTYDASGRRTQSVDQTGFATNYTYDALGRLSKLTDAGGNLIVQYTYDAAGFLIQKDMGNGTRTTYIYNADGEVRSITNEAPDHSTVNSFDDYKYDALGNVLTDTNRDGEWQYTYDADSQLIAAVFAPNASNPDGLAAQSLQYAYDSAGNRTSETVNGVTTIYVVNTVNEYTSSTTNGVITTYRYDLDGNLIAQMAGSVTTGYTYNSLDQLTSVSGPGLSASYTYNSLGYKVSQTIKGVTTRFQIDPVGLGNVVATFSAGALTAHFTYGIGLVSQVGATGNAAYYDFNIVGLTVGITGTDGRYVNQYSYLPFGQSTTIKAELTNPFLFVGQLGVQDDGTGLLDMRARRYDPATGHFTSPDPLGLPGGQANLETYGENNPLRNVDPSGEFIWIVVGVGIFVTLTVVEFTPLVVTWAQRSRAIGTDNPEQAQQAQKNLTPVAQWTNSTNSVISHNVTSEADLLSLVKDYAVEPPDMPKLPRFLQHLPTPSTPSAVGTGQGHLPITNIINTVESTLKFLISFPAPPSFITTIINAILAAARDPNTLIGPAGYGSSNFVAAGSLLPYEVEYENDPTATAPAQRVDITDQLPSGLDWTTLQLSAFGFGSTYVAIPAGLQRYATTVSTTENGQTFDVDVTMNLDPVTGMLSASFQSIDPATGLPPASLLTGFLPPEDGTGHGIGFVSFTINPKAGLATGTAIRNVADITFDRGQTLATDLVSDENPSEGIDPTKQALVTIDATVPTSAVAALPAATTTTSIPVMLVGLRRLGLGRRLL